MQNASAVRSKPKTLAKAPAKELSWSFILLVILSTCVIAIGFFFAARQHFTSMDYGIKNSKLREQLRSLEAEKRRLLLAREVASSPLALQKAARGLRRHPSNDVAASTAVAISQPVGKEMTANSGSIRVKDAGVKSEQPRVIRTVMSVPAEAKPSGETRSRVVDTKKERREKTEVAALLKLR